MLGMMKAKTKSPLMSMLVKEGRKNEGPREKGAMEAPSLGPRDIEVRIKKVTNGYSVHWDSSDYGPSKTAVAGKLKDAFAMAKAYLEGGDSESPAEDKTDTTEA